MSREVALSIEITGSSVYQVGMHDLALLYKIILGISLLYNSGLPIIILCKLYKGLCIEILHKVVKYGVCTLCFCS